MGLPPQVDSAATEIQAFSPFEFRRIIRDDQVVSLTDVRIQKVIDLYYLLEEILFRFKISIRVLSAIDHRESPFPTRMLV